MQWRMILGTSRTILNCKCLIHVRDEQRAAAKIFVVDAAGAPASMITMDQTVRHPMNVSRLEVTLIAALVTITCIRKIRSIIDSDCSCLL